MLSVVERVGDVAAAAVRKLAERCLKLGRGDVRGALGTDSNDADRVAIEEVKGDCSIRLDVELIEDDMSVNKLVERVAIVFLVEFCSIDRFELKMAITKLDHSPKAHKQHHIHI